MGTDFNPHVQALYSALQGMVSNARIVESISRSSSTVGVCSVVVRVMCSKPSGLNEPDDGTKESTFLLWVLHGVNPDRIMSFLWIQWLILQVCKVQIQTWNTTEATLSPRLYLISLAFNK